MAFDEGLAQRMREALDGVAGVGEKRMFGGVGFLVNGDIACGVLRDDLIVRVGPERRDAALARPLTRLFDITGRAMCGWVMVGPEGYESDDPLVDWVEQGVRFARTLPPK
ncbi:MAG: TfoX/Sxy family protein [Nitrospirota bacterium]|jgi:TfoX/Sxy family transcriptional regulator of competence genes